MSIYKKLFDIQQKAKATKDKKNTFGNYTYRSAEGIIEDIKPVLNETNTIIVLTDKMEEVGGRVFVQAAATMIDAESGESYTVTAYAREAESKKGMDEAQITGAASSYARKYALSGLLLLDDNKDADTDEYQAKTQAKVEEPKKEASKKSEAKKQASKKIICADCGNEITPYQGFPPEAIAKKTCDKYGVPICMDCSAIRRANAVKQEEEAQLPFTLE